MAVISLGMSQSGFCMPVSTWLTRNGKRPERMEERVGAQYMKTYLRTKRTSKLVS